MAMQKMDNDAFVFSLNKRKIYNVIKGKNAIGCYGEFGPFFLGAFIINDNSYINGGDCFTKGMNYDIRYNYELTNGQEHFDIKEIEVYEIKIA